MRVDLYSTIHKAQRFHLSRLLNDIGTTDTNSHNEMWKISDRLRHLMDHLRDHSKNEEIYIHPLFRQLGKDEAERLEREHHDLEKEIDSVVQTLDQERWSELYAGYARFLGNYLVHLTEEETAQAEILWTCYDDKTLMTVFHRFKSERDPKAAREDLEFMLPALGDAEIVKMYLGMKASAPAQAFNGACELAAKTLQPKKWQELFEIIQKG